ncbi:Fis family transcriptional regulator [Pseudoalteromonas obscura]|uniref:Fis family transcriptional regulator n=1 Tax=Pseudoalteromonas obscura TaxID=3048491 RepID=A0ABT7EKR7_9GAMM|nr:Fis family transcriptional regulator [Pseudoalteromonas sp. P94(2023)]MDK2595613.1 Fis family transcriptional regulator [Pseudoalteromonas sp. P94(2023)]
MRKSDKKLGKNIVLALTEACDDALKRYKGFEWLTHAVNFQSFPESLSIVCVFDTRENLVQTLADDKGDQLKASIEAKLFSFGIKAKGVKKRIVFDTEEACHTEHDGNWKRRLEGLQNAHHV